MFMPKDTLNLSPFVDFGRLHFQNPKKSPSASFSRNTPSLMHRLLCNAPTTQFLNVQDEVVGPGDYVLRR